MRGVAEAGEHLGAAFGDVRREGHVNTNTALEDGGEKSKYG